MVKQNKKVKDMENEGDGSNPFFKGGDSQNSKKFKNQKKDESVYTANELMHVFRTKRAKIFSIIETTLKEEGIRDRKPKRQELQKAIKQVDNHAKDMNSLIIRTIAKSPKMTESDQLSIYIMKDDLGRLTLEIEAFRQIVRVWQDQSKTQEIVQATTQQAKKRKPSKIQTNSGANLQHEKELHVTST